MPHDNNVDLIVPGHFVKPISIIAGNNIISTSETAIQTKQDINCLQDIY